MGIYHGNIFRLDWTNLELVKVVAEKLASGRSPRQLVVKHPFRSNYNIGFAEQKEKYIRNGYTIVYETNNGN